MKAGMANRHCIPGINRESNSPDGELLCGSVWNKLKRCTQGLARTRIVHYANAPVLTRKKPDVMI